MSLHRFARKSQLILILLFLLAASGVTGQDSLKWKIATELEIPSRILGQNRKIYVHLPNGKIEPGKKYPVLYQLDGEFQLPLVSGLADYLARNTVTVPEMIIIGINTNAYDRQRDLTPSRAIRKDPVSPVDTSATSPTRTSGGAVHFLRFLREELIPYVDSHFPTEHYRILSGHSLGGLLAVYSQLKQPDLFNASIAISPSLWWDDEKLLREIPALLANTKLANKKLFYSIAGEGGQFYADLVHLNKLVSNDKSSGLQSEFRYYPDDTHTGVPARAYNDGIRFIFSDRQLPPGDTSLVQIRAYYDRLSVVYNSQLLPPEGYINGKGYQLLGQNRIREAILFFEENVRNYPASANVFDSLGDGYLAAGEKTKAKQAFRKALALDQGLQDTRKKLSELDKS